MVLCAWVLAYVCVFLLRQRVLNPWRVRTSTRLGYFVALESGHPSPQVGAVIPGLRALFHSRLPMFSGKARVAGWTALIFATSQIVRPEIFEILGVRFCPSPYRDKPLRTCAGTAPALRKLLTYKYRLIFDSYESQTTTRGCGRLSPEDLVDYHLSFGDCELVTV